MLFRVLFVCILSATAGRALTLEEAQRRALGVQ